MLSTKTAISTPKKITKVSAKAAIPAKKATPLGRIDRTISKVLNGKTAPEVSVKKKKGKGASVETSAAVKVRAPGKPTFVGAKNPDPDDGRTLKEILPEFDDAERKIFRRYLRASIRAAEAGNLPKGAYDFAEHRRFNTHKYRTKGAAACRKLAKSIPTIGSKIKD